MTTIKLSIDGNGFIITVDDGIAEIRGETQRAHERHRHQVVTLSAADGSSRPCSLQVEVVS